MELRDQAVKPPRFLTPLPSYKKLIAYLMAFSFLAGFALRLATHSPTDALVYGGAEGIFLIALPALLSAILCASLVARKEFRARLKYFVFTGFAGAIAIAAAFAISAYFLSSSNSQNAQYAVLLANAVALTIWVIALSIGLYAGTRAIPLALVHPLFNLAFLVLWRKLGILENSLAQASFWFLLPKLAVASIVMLLALGGMFWLVNAPARKNFGVSATQAASLFFAQWMQGSKGIEQVFNEMGESVRTNIASVAFRDAKGKLKAAFLVPNVHFGPFGNIGGSEFPAILSKKLGEKLGCTAFVFHGTVYHDFNPVSSASVSQLAEEFEKCLGEKAGQGRGAAFLQSRKNDAVVSGFAFHNGAFLALSPPPFPGGDIDFASGFALSLEAARTLGEVALCDRHTSEGTARKWTVGSEEFYDFLDSIRRLRKPPSLSAFKLGVAADPLEEFSAANGIGKAGLKVAVVEIGGKRHCIALLDANNMLAPLRTRLVDALKHAHKFAYCDVFTSDTHAVNTIDRVHNPLGASISHAKLERAILAAAENAIEDLEPCTARVCKRDYVTRVLGSGKAGEVASTVNAIVAIARIAAPAVFLISLALALLALWLI